MKTMPQENVPDLPVANLCVVERETLDDSLMTTRLEKRPARSIDASARVVKI